MYKYFQSTLITTYFEGNKDFHDFLYYGYQLERLHSIAQFLISIHVKIPKLVWKKFENDIFSSTQAYEAKLLTNANAT